MTRGDDTRVRVSSVRDADAFHRHVRQRRLSARRWSFGSCVLAMVVASATAGIAQTLVPIGIISNRLSGAGLNHEDSIRFALSEYGEEIWSAGQQVRLEPIYADDAGDPKAAQQIAERLVNKQHVVAILGPVDSDSTKAVLEAGLDVPVLSALSTAASLTESGDPLTRSRNPWFFRVTLNDKDRMKQYLQHISRSIDLSVGTQVVLYDDASEFGLGLEDALRRYVAPAILWEKKWSEINGTKSMTPAWFEHLQSDDGVSDRFFQELPKAPNSVFVLGPLEGAVPIVHAISQRHSFDRTPPFFFVGSSSRLLEDAPEGSFTIGDPVLDFRNSPLLREQQADLQRLLTAFKEQSHNPSGGFVVTAYEAAFHVLPDAISRVIAAHGSVPDTAKFREDLRMVLETETFPSLSPWRKIRFEDGSLVEPPPVPVYRVHRDWERIDPAPTRPWVRLQVPKEAQYLQGPVTVTVEAGSLDEHQSVELSVFQADTGEEVVKERLAFTQGQATYTFNPPGPGQYRFKTPDARYVPIDARVTVLMWWSLIIYGLSVFGGFAGALLAMTTRTTPSGSPWVRVLVGGGVGVLLTALSFYGRSVPGWQALPIPSFGNAHELNALATGLVGGLFGPAIINGVLRIPRPLQDATAKEPVSVPT
jgi:substrate-binding family protein